MSVAAIVVAGGRGERYGAQKQFELIEGRSVASRSVNAARSVANLVILVVPENYFGAGEGADVIVVGGSTRSESVRAGLTRLDHSDIVVVHDAARPVATAALFRSVVDTVMSGAAAAIPGLRVTDSLKRVAGRLPAKVEANVDRDGLVAVQTPQAFRRDVLVAAHSSGRQATDDAALVLAAGHEVIVVRGEKTNIKVTTPEDLERVREFERTLA
jgi:2-C-methyl-D-erythritol 4-phosphate cytidylyltransferase